MAAPKTKTVQWDALVAATRGKDDAKEVEYQFSNGRKFYRKAATTQRKD